MARMNDRAQMAELFQRERSVITKHINNAISDREIDEKSTVQLFLSGSQQYQTVCNAGTKQAGIRHVHPGSD